MILLLLTACGDKATDSGTVEPSVDPPEWCAEEMEVTYENFGEGFLLTHCQGCHAADAPNRFGAPETVFFDTEDDVNQWRSSISRTILSEQSMPPAGGITEEELTLVEIWLECDL
jgi:uncharacterized membrane protein